ncbi:MAG TPA: hypothetical protein VFA11_13070 [Acidimicrobiales bacterium]|nr:hypothetical protein [Acidimicrobiales bacterium]
MAVASLATWVTAALAAGANPASTGPVSVTGTAKWGVTTTTLTTPLSSPAGPSTATGGLSPGSCPSSAGGTPAGEGILLVRMAGPGTTWASPTDTSVVVDAQVDQGPTQEIVLFAGSDPFTYEGFVGSIASGRHCVTLTVRPDLSHVTTITPAVQVSGITLGVVPFGSTDYLLESHDPVLYGRSTSAVGDTPLITYGQQSADPDGVDTDLSYVVTWTHEDTGDGTVPAYEWGLWGRMTDIETVLTEKVAPDGKILSASYLSCGCEGAPIYPDFVPENPANGGETDKPYPSSGTPAPLENHLAIRDATGNNDISPDGTSAYRFQQTLVGAPGPGQARETAMDQNPWSYRISGQEVGRETVSSTDSHNFLAGVYPQYLIVDINAQAQNTSSIAVEVQLAGDPTWYSNDYAQMTSPGPPTTFPFYNGGHARTVIKLPLGWNGTPITALRLRLDAPPGGPPPALVGTPAIELIEVTPDYAIEHPSFPAPSVVTATQVVPATGVIGA